MSRTADFVTMLAAITAVSTIPKLAHAQSQDSDPEPLAAVVDSMLRGASVTLRVDGMSCPFCAYGLEKRLREIEAVDDLIIRVSDGLVQIRVKEGRALTDEVLRDAVSRAGFSLREIERAVGT